LKGMLTAVKVRIPPHDGACARSEGPLQSFRKEEPKNDR
jgi:hypothetical protein